MSKLFKVMTAKWDDYYVIAKDYNDARDKVMDHLGKTIKPIISAGGDLQLPTEESITRIECLTSEVIK